jgi:hypothetical protein
MAKKIAKLVSRNVKPVHQHDCEKCRFLGTVIGECGYRQDMYVCVQSTYTDYISRFGSDGPEYGSTTCSVLPYLPAGTIYHLVAALEKKAGYVPSSYRTIG